MNWLKSGKDRIGILFVALISFSFFWKFFIKGLVPIPADVIVGIYYPWRDHIWGGLVAGVPFKNGLLSDIVSIIYPWRVYGMSLLKRGIWPLWIPQALAGAPLLANFQSGLFYPVNILFFILSEVDAWSVYIILQPVLASVFCFLFLRNLKLSAFSSLFGSFIFSFSGFSLVWLEYGIVGHAGLWLPLILLAIDKIAGKPSFFWIAVGALAVGFSILAGYPQISFFVLSISFFYTLYQGRFLKKRKRLLAVFLFFVLGLGLSSAQLLPGLELWQLSIRGTDPTAGAFDFGLNPVKNLILAVAPDFYGNPSTGNFWGWGAYNESASYVGIVGLFLAFLGFFSFRKEKVLAFFKAVLVLALILVFKNPISAFIFSKKLPFLASSSAGRFLFLTSFSLAILASFGAEHLLTKKNAKKLFFLGPFLTGFFILLLVVFLAPGVWPDKNLLVNLVVARRNLILPTGLFLASLFLIVGFYLRPFSKFKKAIFILLFFLLVFDLFRFGFKYNSFSKKDYLYPETELTNFLKNQEGLYRFTGLIPQSMFIPYNLASPEGYDPLMTARYNQFANQINEERLSRIFSGSRWVIVNRHESPLLSLLGTRYLLSFKPDPKSEWEPEYYKYEEKDFELAFQYGYSQVYERKSALPRAFIIHDFKVLPDEEILATLMDEAFDPGKTLLLEEEPSVKPEEKLGEEEAVIDESRYFDNEVLVKTNLASDGFLFLSDNFYPGWKAYVDDQETKIYRVDYTFRAIFVPEGSHEIKFLYFPDSFKYGLTISLFSCILVMGILLKSLIAKR